MDTRAIEARRSGAPSQGRPSAIGEVLLFALSTGVAATMVAAACSLLVSGTQAKRLVWVAAVLLVAAGAGLWRAAAPLTERRRGPGSPPPADRPANSLR
jgi:hypothetical protein